MRSPRVRFAKLFTSSRAPETFKPSNRYHLTPANLQGAIINRGGGSHGQGEIHDDFLRTGRRVGRPWRNFQGDLPTKHLPGNPRSVDVVPDQQVTKSPVGHYQDPVRDLFHLGKAVRDEAHDSARVR